MCRGDGLAEQGEEAMRKLGVWGVAAGLALGLSMSRSAAAGDDPSPWKLFGNSKAEQKKKDEEREALRAQEARKKAAQRRALDDVIRRMAVADALMKLASEANDELALKLAAELHDRAWNLYDKQMRFQTFYSKGGFLATGFKKGSQILPEDSNQRGSAGREKP